MRVRGNAIFPISLAGRFSILLATVRQLCLVLSVAVLSSELKNLDPDVLFVDQLSACIPLFRWLYPKAKVLFYGHFPDRLLVKEASGTTKYFKALYRKPFDALESWSTGLADDVVVNSKFTRSIFKQTFSSMRARNLKVIYPCVDTEAGNSTSTSPPLWPERKVLLSINRFEGKKNLPLAIRGFAGLSPEETNKAKLVIAGGFDARVQENATTHKQLESLADSLKLSHATYRSTDRSIESDHSDVVFLLSVTDSLKQRLLHTACLLVYTPTNEHFGIVPLEAMLAGVPVLATNTGGPLETIYDGRTGWLRSPDKVEQWTEVMRKALIPSSADNLRAMGQRGRERVLAEFSHAKMTESLDREIDDLCRSTEKRPPILSAKAYFVCCSLCGIAFGILGAMNGTKGDGHRSKIFELMRLGRKRSDHL